MAANHIAVRQHHGLFGVRQIEHLMSHHHTLVRRIARLLTRRGGQQVLRVRPRGERQRTDDRIGDNVIDVRADGGGIAQPGNLRMHTQIHVKARYEMKLDD